MNAILQEKYKAWQEYRESRRDEYCELLYDKRKGWLLKDDLSYSGIERIKSITVLADDKYSLKTEIK